MTDVTTVPSLESARTAFARAEKEATFWHAHYQEYVERYPDQFVAVADGQVVAVSPELEHLVGALEARGLDVKQTWVEYIAATPRHIIL